MAHRLPPHPAKGTPEAFAWARKMAKARSVRKAGKKAEAAFFGKKTKSPALKDNPITIVGNPPRSIRANIAGVIYNRCLEIRAEKTGSWKPGLYRHPFARASKVQILALDNGDLLIHSAAGKKLWMQD
jgi:hypothetical protein